jgi:hypothetical protein
MGLSLGYLKLAFDVRRDHSIGEVYGSFFRKRHARVEYGVFPGKKCWRILHRSRNDLHRVGEAVKFLRRYHPSELLLQVKLKRPDGTAIPAKLHLRLQENQMGEHCLHVEAHIPRSFVDLIASLALLVLHGLAAEFFTKLLVNLPAWFHGAIRVVPEVPPTAPHCRALLGFEPGCCATPNTGRTHRANRTITLFRKVNATTKHKQEDDCRLAA